MMLKEIGSETIFGTPMTQAEKSNDCKGLSKS